MKRRKIKYNPQKDYYQILGVESDATQAEVQQAYRQLAKKLHPDLNPDRVDWATDQIQLLNEAYNTLNDPNNRMDYNEVRWPHVSHSARRRSQTDEQSGRRSRTTDPWANISYESPSRRRKKSYSSSPPYYTQQPSPGAWLISFRLGSLRPFYAAFVNLMRSPYRYLLIILGLVIVGNVIFILTNLAGK